MGTRSKEGHWRTKDKAGRKFNERLNRLSVKTLPSPVFKKRKCR